ncbi:MAG: protein-disulfide isomerase [Candidatus Muproteobacteria bacterium RIFCSPHIGHO2_12_FULL_60_33]|uniref:Protein-disulfide isomerase n=1 Tax=Candidatus Muproteobacteria bacterium RIFCSPLOWO2_01_FULL_60_18 TaxID=1817768 RepID=A0A1F6U5U9_9PROT|nr:MAG: protein-disulfide isomerase [Candidatus Muproteobacteria bacterium RIFCSPLOWO2_01_FULL_60_18]OGI53275.1 MAG: protein-disulfide isomerase [Candidatus Muproteobacteria bacterium RIFCSPHIGHO2_01_60_12]OGI53880.1 MAG: protein-disulfide isomerase [Candidatus Muproteobacteria bacterium RIFCSPHIGHO2_02_FULL_60_13]OGI56329.1 MAG: protein-disulfide isomerase [Candidatus Muproteobacteria bacterium RIFCSPHIGHO2_12_FULL_60_33]OGI59271.1 MAG: protein-disulfide isomerase [Candidatus Muproteobacteria 
MTPQRILWYFADPMCSWCWGFAPVISAIKEAYSDRVKIALMLGGLRPGTTEPMTPKSREEILHHWQDVHRMTGQPFAFEGAMPEGFVYDTEPPSRAVIAVADINPEAIFPYFKSVQEAFYARGQNVTQPDTLAALAEHHNIESAVFLDRFRSDDIRKKTQTHFQIARQSGVRGFPTVVLQNGTTGALLTHGYRPFGELQPAIDNWLAGAMAG